MDNASLVAVLHSGHELPESALGLILGHAAVVLQVIEHVPSTKVLRNQEYCYLGDNQLE